jgi:hypothetical protein
MHRAACLSSVPLPTSRSSSHTRLNSAGVTSGSTEGCTYHTWDKSGHGKARLFLASNHEKGPTGIEWWIARNMANSRGNSPKAGQREVIGLIWRARQSWKRRDVVLKQQKRTWESAEARDTDGCRYVGT